MSKALVFVGGFAAPGNEWPLTPIRRTVREQGWRTKYFNERLVFGPIATSAQRLVGLLDQQHEVHDTIVVVGHSMGGLVGEHAGGLGAPIDALVTIGTPHQGHSLSRFGPLPVMREMATNSTYLTGVKALPGPRPGDHRRERPPGVEERIAPRPAARASAGAGHRAPQRDLRTGHGRRHPGLGRRPHRGAAMTGEPVGGIPGR